MGGVPQPRRRRHLPGADHAAPGPGRPPLPLAGASVPTEDARLLLRFGDEQHQETAVELPVRFSIAASPLGFPVSASPSATRGEPALPGQAGIVAWVEGSRRGGDLRQRIADEPAYLKPGFALPSTHLEAIEAAPLGPEATGQRHRAVLSGWASLPWQLRAGGVATYATGRPFNLTTGADNNGDGSTADRPVIDGRVIGRNEGRGDDVYDLSLFLERDFSVGFGTLGLRAEVFNVTDHANVVGYNGVYGNNANGAPLATFSQPLGGINSVDPGRQYQFLARLRF